MNRFHQCVLILSFTAFCWLAMMAVHELGHCLGAWSTGGTVRRVVLHPLAISRTDVVPNPQPLVVVWAGPIFGVLLPLAIWAVFHWTRIPVVYLPRFFAAFCLLANGAYIGVGSFGGVGDAGEMIRHGSPMWLLWVFAALTLPTGLLILRRLGRHFGFGESRGRVHAVAAYVSLALLVTSVVLEIAWSPNS